MSSARIAGPRGARPPPRGHGRSGDRLGCCPRTEDVREDQSARRGHSEINVTDEALASLRRRFNDRLLGLTGLDLSLPADQIVSQIERSVREYDLRGAVMEPGYYNEPDGGPLHADNPRLYPIYESVIALDLFVMHQSGIYAGPDYSVNYWPPLDRLLQNFPRLKLVLAHGGYPAVIDALALAVKHPNFYLSPDTARSAASSTPRGSGFAAPRPMRQRSENSQLSVLH